MHKKSETKRAAKSTRPIRYGFAVLATGMLFSSSCGSAGIQAIIAGIDAAASTLNQSLDGDDLTFGEWLLSELD